MRGIKRIAARFFDIRERRPSPGPATPDDGQDEATPGADGTEASVTGWSREVASASKGVFGGEPEGSAERRDATGGFPSEGEMTDEEASVLLDLVMDAQRDA